MPEIKVAATSPTVAKQRVNVARATCRKSNSNLKPPKKSPPPPPAGKSPFSSPNSSPSISRTGSSKSHNSTSSSETGTSLLKNRPPTPIKPGMLKKIEKTTVFVQTPTNKRKNNYRKVVLKRRDEDEVKKEESKAEDEGETKDLLQTPPSGQQIREQDLQPQHSMTSESSETYEMPEISVAAVSPTQSFNKVTRTKSKRSNVNLLPPNKCPPPPPAGKSPLSSPKSSPGMSRSSKSQNSTSSSDAGNFEKNSPIKNRLPPPIKAGTLNKVEKTTVFANTPNANRRNNYRKVVLKRREEVEGGETQESRKFQIEDEEDRKIVSELNKLKVNKLGLRITNLQNKIAKEQESKEKDSKDAEEVPTKMTVSQLGQQITTNLSRNRSFPSRVKNQVDPPKQKPPPPPKPIRIRSTSNLLVHSTRISSPPSKTNPMPRKVMGSGLTSISTPPKVPQKNASKIPPKGKPEEIAKVPNLSAKKATKVNENILPG